MDPKRNGARGKRLVFVDSRCLRGEYDRIGVWTYPRKVTGWACWLQRSRKRIDELDVESERGLPTKQCTTAATATQIERETQ